MYTVITQGWKSGHHFLIGDVVECKHGVLYVLVNPVQGHVTYMSGTLQFLKPKDVRRK